MASEDSGPQRQSHTSESGGDHDAMHKAPQDRICGFCERGHRDGLEAATDFIDIPTDANIWSSDRPIRIRNCWAWFHTNCVHFSPQTEAKYDEKLERITWANVGTEYRRARALRCAICKERGASIGCSIVTCGVSVHFPCAIKEVLPDGRKNWYPCQDAAMPYFCMGCHSARAEHERSGEIDRLSDLTQGKEAKRLYREDGEEADVVEEAPYSIPADMGLASRKRPAFSSVLVAPAAGAGSGLKRHGSGSAAAAAAVTAAAAFELASVAEQWGQLLPDFPLPRGLLTKSRTIDFTYVADTVDSESAQVRQGPAREKQCCSCTGSAACRDPRICECLQRGRQYTNKGRLLDKGHPAQMYECNLNCMCHKEECRNRLVQRGMTCSIQVVYLGPCLSRVREGSGKWGVVAVEEIPARSFVCTVAGQLVLASDMGDEMDDQGQHRTSVLVHRVRDWTGWNTDKRGNGGVGPSRAQPIIPPLAEGPQERFVDQRRYANVSRYIRCAKHEKDVNLVRVAVHTKNQDPNAPVLALFALRNITGGTELLRSR